VSTSGGALRSAELAIWGGSEGSAFMKWKNSTDSHPLGSEKLRVRLLRTSSHNRRCSQHRRLELYQEVSLKRELKGAQGKKDPINCSCRGRKIPKSIKGKKDPTMLKPIRGRKIPFDTNDSKGKKDPISEARIQKENPRLIKQISALIAISNIGTDVTAMRHSCIHIRRTIVLFTLDTPAGECITQRFSCKAPLALVSEYLSMRKIKLKQNKKNTNTGSCCSQLITLSLCKVHVTDYG
jgi:hypothetical protein